jgi:hypothetical protein
MPDFNEQQLQELDRYVEDARLETKGRHVPKLYRVLLYARCKKCSQFVSAVGADVDEAIRNMLEHVSCPCPTEAENLGQKAYHARAGT